MRYMASVAAVVRCNSGDQAMCPTSMVPSAGSIRRYDATPVACWEPASTIAKNMGSSWATMSRHHSTYSSSDSNGPYGR